MEPTSRPDPPPADDLTGAIAQVRLELADFLDGDPDLPVLLLMVVKGPARGDILRVTELPAVIGRSLDVDVVVGDDTVSRRHAEFRGDRDAVEVEDLGSSNGTTLNGNPIAGAITLHDGDLLALGSCTMLVKRVH